MCGIFGFTGKNNKRLLAQMADALRHRGPDGDGFYSDDHVNLGMRRLAIVDIDSGSQPVFNEDKTVVVLQNGEIYNHRELRKELEKKGHRFRSDHSDTEVIPHLYECYQEEWANHVNGMFAAVIWDSAKQQMTLWRDRIGKKPLYYAFRNGTLIFGSEIKAILLHPAVSRELDPIALYGYFGLKNISAPRTIYKDIKQLLPGEYLCWKEEGIFTKRYWQIDFSHAIDIGEEEAAEKILAILEDSVRLRMDCDAPYGAYLSGGVDSSAIVTLMTRFSTKPVKTFCLVYEETGDETWKGKEQDKYYARKMAKRLGTEHHEYLLTPKTFAERMPEVMKAFDEPFSGTISTLFLSMLIQRHVKVAISGDGADELFGSYLPHRLAFAVENYNRLLSQKKVCLEDLSEEEKYTLRPFDVPEKYAVLCRIADPNLATWRSKLNVFSADELENLLNRDILESVPLAERNFYVPLARTLTATDALNRVLEIDQKELLPNQVLPFVDRLSMAHSIEVRVPFLDYRFVEFVNSLPGRMKIKDGTNKYIHKLAMKRLLPHDLLNRPKEGFVQPNYVWMHTVLKKWMLENLDALPKELFNVKFLAQLHEKFENGDRSINDKIWNLSCFSLWWRSRQSGSKP